MRDFSLFTYRGLLQAIKTAGIPVFGISQWLEKKPPAGILLRHDIDRKPDMTRNAANYQTFNNAVNRLLRSKYNLKPQEVDYILSFLSQ